MSDVEAVSEVEPMVAVYRHDVHKLRGRSHEGAAEMVGGVRVNEEVPLGADGDAALLSRPREDPEQTVANHASPYRLSLLTGGEAAGDELAVGAMDDSAVVELVRHDDPVAMHSAWVSSRVAAGFNESVYYPYTSLKYHTLLAGALLDNYREGHGFEELFLVVDPPVAGPTNGDESASDGGVVPHRTVVATSVVSLRVTASPGERPAARLGGVPARSFGDVWARLPVQPLEVADDRRGMMLDAQLRRVRSWSTALQYIEDYVRLYGASSGWGAGG